MNRKEPRPALLRSAVAGLCALSGFLFVSAAPAGCQSGGLGDPCVPEDEYNSQFPGFDMAEESIESRSFQCETRICLVNHFQGRVSCPLGQEPPQACASPDDTVCGEGRKCVEAATLSAACDPDAPDGGAAQCAGLGGRCDKASRSCVCDGSGGCAAGARCDPVAKQCKRYVCHTPGSCQSGAADESSNQGKACCVPGTDTPVQVPVCGQCTEESNRNTDRAVYCSCRCGPPDEAAPDEDFNYCDCPTGFECKEIRKDYNISDKQLTGKYCIKQGTAYEESPPCSLVKGFSKGAQCAGSPAGG